MRAATMLRGYPDLLTVQDIQNILHIGRSTAYKLVRSGEVESFRIGSTYRIPKTKLRGFIEQ